MDSMHIKTIVKELCETDRKKRVQYILNFLRQNNISFNIQTISSDSINIEVIRAGKKKDQEIIFLAHYDVFNDITEGANDNVSSVAVLLSLTKFLYFYEPEYTIKIIFNDSEEILGAIEDKNNSFINNLAILEKIGSYRYLKNEDKNKVKMVIILELSGIGDSIYFSSSSGGIECDERIIGFLKTLSDSEDIKSLTIPISLTDYFSVDYFGFRGTVIGAIPYIEGKYYMENIGKTGSIKENYPHVWKKNHTGFDKYFSIQEKSLDMIYNFSVRIIEKINNF